MDGGAAVGTGLTRFWGQRLAPGDRGAAQRVTVGFTVEASAGRARQLDSRGLRWGYHWGENAPGWDAGVILRWTDALHFYRLQVSASRGEIALWDSAGGFLQLIPCELSVGTRHELSVLADGAHLVATLDGAPVMDYWDRTLPHEGGQVGLAVLESTVRFGDFAVEELAPSGEQAPPHRPDFRLDTTDGGIVFDGKEPILVYRQENWDPSRQGNRGAVFQESVRLRPGWRPGYYTWVGPKVNLRVLPLVGEFPAALRVTEQGEQLVFDFALEEPEVARAEETCTIGWDAQAGAYSYRYDVHVAFLNAEPMNFWYFELVDPLTYNNREPGPQVEHRWAWAGHRFHVFQGPQGDYQHYPLIDYLFPEFNNMPTKWGDLTSYLHPDPAICPTWKIAMGWPQDTAAGREFRLGLCHWGYDFHQKEEGPHIQLPPGTERDYSLTLTGTPPEEVERAFATSTVAPRVAASQDEYAVFDPSGTTFDRTSTRTEPRGTMVFEEGALDREIGHGDRNSLRIDGPGNARVQVYQYAVEQYAERWWLRGWVKSADVRGRGLQARIKYSYGPEPEDVFYIGARGTNDWTPFSFVTEVLTRRDSTTLTFELDGVGQVWLDDLSLSALPPGEEPAVTVVEVPAGLEPAGDRVIDLAMDEQPLRAVYDDSRHGHALYLEGPTWMAEEGRGFLRFDGIDDYATMPIKPVLEPLRGPPDELNQLTIFPLQAFSWELWIRPAALPEGTTREHLLHFRQFPRIWLDTGSAPEGQLRLVYLNQVYRAEEIKFIETVPIGEWTQLVTTHGDGVARLYINGEQVAELPYDATALGHEFFAYDWHFGVGSWFEKRDYYAGDLGPLRLHTSALTSEQVRASYEAW